MLDISPSFSLRQGPAPSSSLGSILPQRIQATSHFPTYGLMAWEATRKPDFQLVNSEDFTSSRTADFKMVHGSGSTPYAYQSKNHTEEKRFN